jgi:hypothetical protein
LPNLVVESLPNLLVFVGVLGVTVLSHHKGVIVHDKTVGHPHVPLT